MTARLRHNRTHIRAMLIFIRKFTQTHTPSRFIVLLPTCLLNIADHAYCKCKKDLTRRFHLVFETGKLLEHFQ